jgi:hypothetical protein
LVFLGLFVYLASKMRSIRLWIVLGFGAIGTSLSTITLYILHFIFYTLHSTPLHSTLYTLHSTFYTPQSTFCSLLYILHSTLLSTKVVTEIRCVDIAMYFILPSEWIPRIACGLNYLSLLVWCGLVGQNTSFDITTLLWISLMAFDIWYLIL